MTFTASSVPQADFPNYPPAVFVADADGSNAMQIGYGVDPHMTAGGDAVVYTESGGGNHGAQSHWDDALAEYSMRNGVVARACAAMAVAWDSHRSPGHPCDVATT